MDTHNLTPTPRPLVLTVTEVAAMYRVHRSHVYNAVKEGTLKAGKFGVTIRIRHEDAERWFDSLTAA
ncbi:helix-turn-helix domain-containing protein [Deinococcus deserti]|uniref:Putative excisionase n=1 Tax=Deinococcus deserti (strain DSM 17065 / CIP 109153 / LMG 22923 / VCD115) TaxID=546414 RepID=X5HLD6_DEIDV|nr:helix-turn-helix domain-containing protein [Deinococcus deserti]AHX26501.1 putative excisionase [Deinococcus deserti VCD115]